MSKPLDVCVCVRPGTSVWEGQTPGRGGGGEMEHAIRGALGAPHAAQAH